MIFETFSKTEVRKIEVRKKSVLTKRFFYIGAGHRRGGGGAWGDKEGGSDPPAASAPRPARRRLPAGTRSRAPPEARPDPAELRPPSCSVVYARRSPPDASLETTEQRWLF